MKKLVISFIAVVVSTLMVGCGSTPKSIAKPTSNAGTVNILHSLSSENIQATQALKHAIQLFDKKRFAEAEQAFWALDKAYSSSQEEWGMRVISSALTCQLAQGDIERFKNDVQQLQVRASANRNVPRYSQSLLAMAAKLEVNAASNVTIDSRISNWFNSL